MDGYYAMMGKARGRRTNWAKMVSIQECDCDDDDDLTVKLNNVGTLRAAPAPTTSHNVYLSYLPVIVHGSVLRQP